MEFVHIDSEAFNKLKKQLDNIEREIRKLRDPVQVVSSEWITIDEAAQILRVTRRTMFTYMRKKTITPNRINRKSYFHIDDIRELIAKRDPKPGDGSLPRSTNGELNTSTPGTGRQR